MAAHVRARFTGSAPAARDRGMVSAEAALAALSLTLLLMLLMPVFAVLAAQLRVSDAARVAARSAAAGADDAESLALRSAPLASVTITRDGSTVIARATQRVSLNPLPSIDVSSEATVLDEAALVGLVP